MNEETMEEIFKDAGVLERAELKGLIKYREKAAVEEFIEEYENTYPTGGKDNPKWVISRLKFVFETLYPPKE